MKAFIIGSSFIITAWLAACGGNSSPSATQAGANVTDGISECQQLNCPVNNCLTMSLGSATDSACDANSQKCWAKNSNSDVQNPPDNYVCVPGDPQCKNVTTYCYSPATGSITQPANNGNVPFCQANFCGSQGCGDFAFTDTTKYTCPFFDGYCFDEGTGGRVCVSDQGGGAEYPVPTAGAVACDTSLCVGPNANPGSNNFSQCSLQENLYSFTLGAGECPTDGSTTMCEYLPGTATASNGVDVNKSIDGLVSMNAHRTWKYACEQITGSQVAAVQVTNKQAPLPSSPQKAFYDPSVVGLCPPTMTCPSGTLGQDIAHCNPDDNYRLDTPAGANCPDGYEFCYDTRDVCAVGQEFNCYSSPAYVCHRGDITSLPAGG